MNGSVLLVDDDEAILELLSEYLALEDFEIVGCGTNGLEAVNLYEQFKPDFVIMDIGMPNYDGVYGLEHIKKINPDSTVIILTGNNDKLITQKIIQLKVLAVLFGVCAVILFIAVKTQEGEAFSK